MLDKVKPNFFLLINGERPSDGSQFSISLGPWTSLEKAVAYSDQLTDTRIGEQLLEKLGVEELRTYEA